MWLSHRQFCLELLTCGSLSLPSPSLPPFPSCPSSPPAPATQTSFARTWQDLLALACTCPANNPHEPAQLNCGFAAIVHGTFFGHTCYDRVPGLLGYTCRTCAQSLIGYTCGAPLGRTQVPMDVKRCSCSARSDHRFSNLGLQQLWVCDSLMLCCVNAYRVVSFSLRTISLRTLHLSVETWHRKSACWSLGSFKNWLRLRKNKKRKASKHCLAVMALMWRASNMNLCSSFYLRMSVYLIGFAKKVPWCSCGAWAI